MDQVIGGIERVPEGLGRLAQGREEQHVIGVHGHHHVIVPRHLMRT
jgi:hypothetical protein